jgi:hypothetical protein
MGQSPQQTQKSRVAPDTEDVVQPTHDIYTSLKSDKTVLYAMVAIILHKSNID